MLTIALSRLTHETPAALRAFGNYVRAFFEGIDEARAMAQRFESLTRMSDVELASRGLKRADIARAAFAGPLS